MDIPFWKAYYYNNPLLIAGSIGFFLFMLTFHFHSNVVNRIAASSIGMYLAFNSDVIKRIIQLSDSKFYEGGGRMYTYNADSCDFVGTCIYNDWSTKNYYPKAYHIFHIIYH